MAARFVRATIVLGSAAERCHVPMTRQEAVAELSEEKRNLLAESDLVWIWTHEAWGSKPRRQILSHEWIKRRPYNEVARALTKRPSGEGWGVLIDETPPPGVVARMIAELG